jgi:hypothetical protein
MENSTSAAQPVTTTHTIPLAHQEHYATCNMPWRALSPQTILRALWTTDEVAPQAPGSSRSMTDGGLGWLADAR